MPEYDNHRKDNDSYLHHGVSKRYDPIFNAHITMGMIHYFQFVEHLTLDEAIKKVDDISKHLRNTL
jgi:hypothetical protein